MQFLQGIASILMQLQHSKDGSRQFEECVGVKESGLMPAVIFLLIGGLVKICIFNFSLNMNFDYKLNLLCKKIKMSVSNILVTFMVANLIIFAMVYTLITNENNC